MQRLPSPALSVRVNQDRPDRPFYEAYWRFRGRVIKRRIGPAWLERDSHTGAWIRRRGRVADDHYTEFQAAAAAEQLVKAHADHAEEDERIDTARRARAASFGDVAYEYLVWLQQVKQAKPSTLRDHGYLLAIGGRVMNALGDRPADQITTADIEELLESIAATGVKPRTVNKVRQLLRAVFYFGCKPTTFALTHNPVVDSSKRREPDRTPPTYYSPADIELLARALEDGPPRATADADREQLRENRQDAELVRVAAYTGLRLGELLALRWSDVDFAAREIVVRRAVSAGVETASESHEVRRVPLTDQAAAALGRLRGRQRFTKPNDLVFVNDGGRHLDRWALRERYVRARDAAALRPLRLHDLRHTYGSLLAAAGIDLPTIQAAMGHRAIATTEVYMRARPAADQAAAFSRAFTPEDAGKEARTSNGDTPTGS